LEHASLAVGAGVDGIVAQGLQAGGHVKSEAPTLDILKKILALVPSSVIVLASGGVGGGRHLVEALSHGAEGVWIRTRFLASNEASAHPEYKRAFSKPPATALKFPLSSVPSSRISRFASCAIR
jgi:nitronate monooxygenase